MAGKNILFVCSANVKRSPSAEAWFKWIAPENEYNSAGANRAACKIHGGTYVSKPQLQKADRIICMEERNRKDLEKTFGNEFSNKTEVSGIPDNYNFMEVELLFEFMDKIKID